ncbi:uncharacterized protein LOC142357515 [Convolutriloba macropyga]|uniref:uncharacterized protein LOC142357515 n=1 Tax=Convolutriloba macropyga TaxID=536237 RepID=UPI003F525B93
MCDEQHMPRQYRQRSMSATKSSREFAMRWDVAELMGGPGLGRQRKNVVPTPRLAHTARWLAGQTFGPEDDPDRIAVPLQLPDFVRAGPHSSRKFIGSRKIRKERVNFPPGAVKPGLMFCPSTPRGSFARMHHNVLSRRECAQLVDACNAKGFTPSLMNLGSGIQVYRPDMRSSYRCVSDSHALSSYLFEVLRPHLPPVLLLGSRGEPCVPFSINERCRVQAYVPNQSFLNHWDGCFRYPQDHPGAGALSLVTVLLYLNDVSSEKGGATAFTNPSTSQRCPLQPRAGSVLLFTQDLCHEGSTLLEGFKYVLRTEVMYKLLSSKS